MDGFRALSEYCSACVSRVGLKDVFQLSKQQYLTRTTFSTVLRTPPNPYSDKEIPLRRALGAVALLVDFSTGNPSKIGTFTAGNRTQNRTRHFMDGLSVPKCLFFLDLEGLPKFFGRLSVGISAPSFWKFPNLVVSNLVVDHFFCRSALLHYFAPFCAL